MDIIQIVVFLSCLITAALAQLIPQKLLPGASIEVQKKAVEELIKRSIGEDASQKFIVNVDNTLAFRSFNISKGESDDVVHITGSDGVSVAKAFNLYLKYFLLRDISWTDTTVELPANVELPYVMMSSASSSAFIYYQNVCTWSYSFAWWDWSLWRSHIDWMAMMGITLTIAPVQEFIWHGIYRSMELSENEISDHFAGPAFQAWQRMGNIRGWGGPLPITYQRMQILLQKRIVKAQRDLGISVALPAFAGHVPIGMARIYPDVNFTAVERWNNFPYKFSSVLFLDPNEALFRKIAVIFLRYVIGVYGTDHIYFADPFNEIQPRLATAAYLNMTAANIYESMRVVDSNSVWLLQGWMFVKNVFWTDELVKAFLMATPQGRMIVLDLQSEKFPQYKRTHSFHGQPFIWCMLHNFGGTLGMHGSVDVVNTQIREARAMPGSTMIGVGITPEGINQNYAMYALTLERGWSRYDFNVKTWFDAYADARYGIKDERLRAAMQILRESVYSYNGLRRLRGKYTITRRPSLSLDPWHWYNASSVHQAWMLMLAANTSVPRAKYSSYEYDLVDVTRQFLQVMADRLYVNLIAAYKQRNDNQLIYIAAKIITIFEDLDAILATNVHFMLGPWLAQAKQMGQTALERRLFEVNARNQITGWGPRGEILDYATKQWSGIVRDYYQPRWQLFLETMSQCLKDNVKFDKAAFNEIVSKEIENPFSVQTKVYPIEPSINTFNTSHQIFSKWTLLFYVPDFLQNLQLHVRIIKT